MAELLFEARTNLGGMSGRLQFFQRPPEIHPEPLLQADTEADGGMLSLYGSVLRDGGKFRMWYYAAPRRRSVPNDANFVAYAESDDGLHWVKPALGLVMPELPENNLTGLGLHSATVFIDPDSPAEFRYRATGCGRREYANPFQQFTQPGYYTAHSADGLRWTLDSPEPRWRMIDVITSIWHPGRHCGLIALKRTPTLLRMARRSIHTAEFRDGVYSDDVSALYPDEYDDMLAAHRGYHSADYYGMGMMPAGTATVGFLWNFWHAVPYYRGFGNGPQALYGTSDVTLVYQPEPGGRWLHLPGRPLFIDHERLPWRTGWVNTAANVIEVGNEQRLYFSARNTTHGFGLDEGWKPLPAADRSQETSYITFAHWPKWRLFGFESLPEGTLEIRLGDLAQPSELRLNYEMNRPHGSIRAALTGAEGSVRDLTDSLPLTGSALAGRVEWKTGAVIPPTPNAKLTLHLQNARVYAYEVTSAG